MLTEIPKAGQFVQALSTEYWSDTNERYQTKGSVYQIKRDAFGLAHIIGDNDRVVIIDEYSVDLYELYEEECEVKMVGLSARAWDFDDKTVDFDMSFEMKTDNREESLMKVTHFQKDVQELINKKYS